ncbi:hypothetical protein ABPG75_007931 [Micractinium tetrahymenae]
MADRKADPRTVFVRGVDSSVTDTQLQEFFSEVGPVKKAFLVRKGGKDGAHRGFGFVQFAVAEDAARAAAELHGAELAGRKLKVEGAVKRAPLEERKKRKQDAAAAPAQQPPAAAAAAGAEAEAQPPPAKKPRPARPAAAVARDAAAAEGKHKWLRAVAVGGLTAEAVEAAVQMARAAGEVQEVISPVPDKLAAQFMLKRDGCTGEAVVAVYKSVKEAIAAVAKLHGQAAGGGQQQQQQQGKKGKKAAAAAGGAACRLWARQLSGEGLHHKRWRLIVRNLPFTASEEDLRAAFSPAGFVWEVTLPRSASGRGRGFAFVGFTCKAHAERGIQLVNGQAVAGRPVAVDWAVSKSQFGAQAAAGAPGGGDGAGEAAEGSGSARQRAGIDALSDLESDDEEQAGGAAPRMGREEEGEAGEVAALAPEQERRMLASVIDGILSDDEGEAGSDGGGEDGSDDEEAGSEEEDSEGEEAAGSSDEEEGSGDEEDDDGSGSEKEEEAAAGQPAARAADPFSRKQLQQKAAAATAQDGDAQQQPQRPPPEEGATVFIRGLPLDVTKEQVFLKMKAFGPVRSCRLVVDKDSGKLKGTAFVDFYKKASAQAAADACAKGRRKEGPGVVIAGRVADVDMALGQDDVRALAVAKAGEKGERSQRLALAKEGQIAEGSPAWEDMSAGDRAKRKRAAEEKKLKLRSPNFVVSDTRLSVRNIPPSWTEKQLKACFIQAVKERAKKAQPVIKQAKILLDEERTGADGAPHSKGIGFVEFSEHEHALCALRQLNNNPQAFTKDKRPIVEFALENVKALKFREAKLQRKQLKAMLREKREQQKAEGGDAAAANGTPGDGEKNKAAKRREQRKRALRVQQKKRKKEETDSVDALAKQYLSKFFDAPASGAKKGGSGGKQAAAVASQRAALKRWFE